MFYALSPGSAREKGADLKMGGLQSSRCFTTETSPVIRREIEPGCPGLRTEAHTSQSQVSSIKPQQIPLPDSVASECYAFPLPSSC